MADGQGIHVPEAPLIRMEDSNMIFSELDGFRLPGIRGRNAIVTGGAQGIGSAIAQLLSDQGANVHVLDITLPEKDARNKSFNYIRCDVADVTSVDAAFAEVETAHGGVSILINNAGVLRQSPFEEITQTDWDLTFKVNLTAAMVCCQRALPSMRETGFGRVVFIGSSAGKAGGGPGLAAYAASKAGVMSLAKSLAKEYSHYGVTVNAVAPAAIATEMIRDLSGFPGGQALPVGRLGQPDEVAAAVAFLCSNAAAFITGEILDVNGGMIID
jgi:NAD(P)-dependent dehydrogenase (short-subunit alcohol dehydrogenase family)